MSHLRIDKGIPLPKRDTGINMTYVQIFNFLIHFYVERANEPKSKWKALS